VIEAPSPEQVCGCYRAGPGEQTDKNVSLYCRYLLIVRQLADSVQYGIQDRSDDRFRASARPLSDALLEKPRWDFHRLCRRACQRKDLASFSSEFPPIQAAKTVLAGFSLGNRFFQGWGSLQERSDEKVSPNGRSMLRGIAGKWRPCSRTKKPPCSRNQARIMVVARMR